MKKSYYVVAGIIVLFILGIFASLLVINSDAQPSLQSNQPNTMDTMSPIDENIARLLEEGKSNEAKQALAAAVSDPTTHPFSLYSYSANLFELGNREQAAFVFYLAQVRTRVYLEFDPDPSGSAALRSALNDVVGQVINPWVGSDVDSWKRIAFGAVAYEKTLPYPAPEFGVAKEVWEAAIIAEQAAYAADMESFLLPLEQSSHAIVREENGLYAGPLQDPGDPLLEAWIQ